MSKKMGLFIREWRQYRGMTQAELANRSRIFRPTLSNIENGVQRPREKTLKRISRALRVPLSSLEHNPFAQIKIRGSQVKGETQNV